MSDLYKYYGESKENGHVGLTILVQHPSHMAQVEHMYETEKQKADKFPGAWGKLVKLDFKDGKRIRHVAVKEILIKKWKNNEQSYQTNK